MPNGGPPPGTVYRFMRGPGSERITVPRPSSSRRGTRSAIPTTGRSPRSGAHSTMGGETLPSAPPAGPPPADVLRDNQDLYPRAQQSYQQNTSTTVKAPKNWRLPPSTPIQPDIPNLTAEGQNTPITDAEKRRLATFTPDLQRSIVAGSVAAGLPQTDETYRRLMDSTTAAAMTPGTPYEDQAARNAAEQQSEEPTPPEYIVPTYIPSLNATFDLRNFGDAGPPTLEEAQDARGSLLQAAGTDAPEPTPEEIAEEVLRAREED